MKKISIEGLLDLNKEQIEIVYRRCRGEKVINIAEAMILSEATIYNNRMPGICEKLGVNNWKEAEAELSKPLRKIIPSVSALKEGWPDAFKEKIEALSDPSVFKKVWAFLRTRKSWSLIAIPILFLLVFVVSRLYILASPMPPTLEPTAPLTLIPPTPLTVTAVAGCTELSSMSLSGQPIDPYLENRKEKYWSATNDGTGNTVLQANTPAEGADLRFGPEFSNGCIEYRFKLLSFDTDKDKNSGKIELNLRVLKQSPEEAYVVAFIPNLGRAGLYYRNEGEPDWEELKCDKDGQQQDCKSDPIDFEATKNKWFYVAVDIEGANINVFLKVESQDGFKWEKIFKSQDTRLKEGAFSVAAGPYTTAYIDDVLIWEAKP